MISVDTKKIFHGWTLQPRWVVHPQRDVLQAMSIVSWRCRGHIASIYGGKKSSSKNDGFDPPDSFFHTILLQKQI